MTKRLNPDFDPGRRVVLEVVAGLVLSPRLAIARSEDEARVLRTHPHASEIRRLVASGEHTPFLCGTDRTNLCLVLDNNKDPIRYEPADGQRVIPVTATGYYDLASRVSKLVSEIAGPGADRPVLLEMVGPGDSHLGYVFRNELANAQVRFNIGTRINALYSPSYYVINGLGLEPDDTTRAVDVDEKTVKQLISYAKKYGLEVFGCKVTDDLVGSKKGSYVGMVFMQPGGKLGFEAPSTLSLVAWEKLDCTDVQEKAYQSLRKNYQMGKVLTRWSPKSPRIFSIDVRGYTLAFAVFSNDNSSLVDVPLKNGVYTVGDIVIGPGFSRGGSAGS